MAKSAIVYNAPVAYLIHFRLLLLLLVIPPAPLGAQHIPTDFDNPKPDLFLLLLLPQNLRPTLLLLRLLLLLLTPPSDGSVSNCGPALLSLRSGTAGKSREAQVSTE